MSKIDLSDEDNEHTQRNLNSLGPRQRKFVIRYLNSIDSEKKRLMDLKVLQMILVIETPKHNKMVISLPIRANQVKIN